MHLHACARPPPRVHPTHGGTLMPGGAHPVKAGNPLHTRRTPGEGSTPTGGTPSHASGPTRHPEKHPSRRWMRARPQRRTLHPRHLHKNAPRTLTAPHPRSTPGIPRIHRTHMGAPEHSWGHKDTKNPPGITSTQKHPQPLKHTPWITPPQETYVPPKTVPHLTGTPTGEQHLAPVPHRGHAPQPTEDQHWSSTTPHGPHPTEATHHRQPRTQVPPHHMKHPAPQEHTDPRAHKESTDHHT